MHFALFQSAPAGAKIREPVMNANEIYDEIKELNLNYLMLAQQLIRADRETAQYRLGVSKDIAEIIAEALPS